jgi:hypothetical protein
MLRWLAASLVATALAQGMAFTTVARGDISGQQIPRQVTIRTPAEWESLWKAHSPGEKLPAVDFASRMVVGVFLGSKPSTGYQAEIVDVRKDGDALVVSYVETEPPAGMLSAQILTEPFHLVSVPAHTGPVRFTRTEKK